VNTTKLDRCRPSMAWAAVVACTVLVAALCSGCAPAPQLDANEPLPNGRVLVGKVLGTEGMVYTAAGQEVTAPTIVPVDVDGSNMSALWEDPGVLSSGQWVEIREGTNGRWFVTGLTEEPPSAAAQPSEPVAIEADASELVVLLESLLNDAEDFYRSKESGADKKALKVIVARMEKTAAKAKRYRVWNDMYTPREEATYSINKSIEGLVLGCGYYVDEASKYAIRVEPGVGELYLSLADWPDLISEGSPFVVEEQ